MAKYHALKQFLLSSEQPKIKLSLSDIEEIIGDKLPYSAYTYNAWWSNKGHSHAEFWTTAGFLTEKVDLTNRTVVFSQQEKTETPAAPQRSTPRSPQRFAAQVFNTQHRDVLTVHGYAFHFVQQLIPECEDGQVKEYAPQREYANHDICLSAPTVPVHFAVFRFPPLLFPVYICGSRPVKSSILAKL